MRPRVIVYVVCRACPADADADAADGRLCWYVVDDPAGKGKAALAASAVLEHELPVYEPGLRTAGCGEASALFHALANEGLRDAADFVGFARPDTRPSSAALDAFEAAVVGGGADGAAKVGVGCLRPWAEVVGGGGGEAGVLPAAFWEELLGVFLPPGADPAQLADGAPRFPLRTTFVLPTAAFVEMMTDVNAIAPDVHAALGGTGGHELAGTLERVFGAWIAAAAAGGRLEAVQL